MLELASFRHLSYGLSGRVCVCARVHVCVCMCMHVCLHVCGDLRLVPYLPPLLSLLDTKAGSLTEAGSFTKPRT